MPTLKYGTFSLDRTICLLMTASFGPKEPGSAPVPPSASGTSSNTCKNVAGKKNIFFAFSKYTHCNFRVFSQNSFSPNIKVVTSFINPNVLKLFAEKICNVEEKVADTKNQLLSEPVSLSAKSTQIIEDSCLYSVLKSYLDNDSGKFWPFWSFASFLVKNVRFQC